MAVAVGEGYIPIKPDLSGFGKDVERQTTGAMGSIKNFAKNAAAVFAGAFAVTKGIDFLKGAVDAASNLNETVSKARTIFGPAAADLESWATTAAKSFGQSKQQALDAAGSFGNMFVQLGIGSNVAAGMSKSMVELASDFASFHNADITEVLTAQQAAFRGEYDALQRFVPTINAAAVEEEALRQTGKKLKDELTLQEKALATQALMMKGAGDAAGDFARTSDGLANKQRIQSAQWADMQAKIGNGLLPIMTAFTGFIITKVIPAIAGLGRAVAAVAGFIADWIVPIGVVTGVITAVFLPLLLSLAAHAVASAATQVAAWASTAAGAVAAAVAHSAQVAVQIAKWALLGVQSMLHAAKVAAAWLISMGPIALVIAAVVGLVALIVKNWETIKDVIAAGWEFVKSATSAVWEAIKGLISGAIDFIVMLFLNFTGPGLLIKHWNTIRDTTIGIWNGIKDFIGGILNTVVGFIAGMPGRIASAAQGMWDGIKNAFKSAINWIIRAWNNLEFEVPGVKVFGKTIGGFTIGTPDIPTLHSGGMFHAPTLGGEGLARLRDRELITTPEDQAAVIDRLDLLLAAFDRQTDWQIRLARTS